MKIEIENDNITVDGKLLRPLQDIAEDLAIKTMDQRWKAGIVCGIGVIIDAAEKHGIKIYRDEV